MHESLNNPEQIASKYCYSVQTLKFFQIFVYRLRDNRYYLREQAV